MFQKKTKISFFKKYFQSGKMLQAVLLNVKSMRDWLGWGVIMTSINENGEVQYREI